MIRAGKRATQASIIRAALRHSAPLGVSILPFGARSQRKRGLPPIWAPFSTARIAILVNKRPDRGAPEKNSAPDACKEFRNRYTTDSWEICPLNVWNGRHLWEINPEHRIRQIASVIPVALARTTHPRPYVSRNARPLADHPGRIPRGAGRARIGCRSPAGWPTCWARDASSPRSGQAASACGAPRPGRPSSAAASG